MQSLNQTMPHRCSKPSPESSFHSEQKPKSFQWPTMALMILTQCPLPSSASTTLSPLLLLEHTKHTLILGPLQLLSPLPGILPEECIISSLLSGLCSNVYFIKDDPSLLYQNNKPLFLSSSTPHPFPLSSSNVLCTYLHTYKFHTLQREYSKIII